MKTRAAILSATKAPPPYASSLPLAVTEVDLAAPGPGEVLVRVRAAGLCHSDLSVIDGNRPRPLPMVLGHEAAATLLSGARLRDALLQRRIRPSRERRDNSAEHRNAVT